MTKAYLANVTLDHDLLLEFFLTFARFEFALKDVGFVTGDHREAKPDWNSFGRSLDLAEARREPGFAAAYEYLSLQPPARQVLVAGGLAWDTAVPFSTPARMDQVLQLVRRIRNNLFHGGKFNDEMHSGPERNRLLPQHALAILRRCRELSPAVARSFGDAAL